jgi:hypothetical protein
VASPAIASSAIAKAADTPPQARAEEAPEEFLMLLAMSLPRGPRPDVTFVLLVTMLIAAGVAFFSVMSNVHASELPALRAASIATDRIDPMPMAESLSIGTATAGFTSIKIGRRASTFDDGGLHVGGALDVNGDPVVTRQQLAMLLPGNPLDALRRDRRRGDRRLDYRHCRLGAWSAVLQLGHAPVCRGRVARAPLGHTRPRRARAARVAGRSLLLSLTRRPPPPAFFLPTTPKRIPMLDREHAYDFAERTVKALEKIAEAAEFELADRRASAARRAEFAREVADLNSNAEVRTAIKTLGETLTANIETGEDEDEHEQPDDDDDKAPSAE